MLLSFVLTVVVALWSGSVSSLSCRTPAGQDGLCTLVSQCPFIREQWKTMNRKWDHDYIMSFRCGKELESGKPLVCCPELRNVDRCGQLTMSDNIFGGEEAELGEYPWVAAVAYTNGRVRQFACGGSLINDRYVLTAAHCVKEPKVKKWTLDFVRLGEWDMNTSPDCKTDSSGNQKCNGLHKDFNVSKVIIHEGYLHDDRKKWNDIAILKLYGTVTYTKSIAPICIPTKEMAISLDVQGTRFDVAGWGITENRTQSVRKMKVTVPGRNISYCAKGFRTAPSFFKDSQLCAGGEKGKDSCMGDSGGPLMVVVQNRWQLFGIVSYGSTKCGSEKVPAIYTRVGSYLDWVAGQLELEGRELQ